MEDVVIEAVLLVPHAGGADLVHRAGDQHKLDSEGRRQIFIDRIVRRELKGNLEHVLGIEGHPCGAIGLLEVASGWQWRAAVEDADIVEPEKPPFEEIPAEAVFAVNPPAEIGSELAKHPLQKIEVGLAAQRLLPDKGISPGDIYTSTSCTSGSACCRGKNSI